jgi:hypothetical protein
VRVQPAVTQAPKPSAPVVTADPVVAPRPRPARHHRTHRHRAPVAHRVAPPDVMVPVAAPHSAAATSSRDALLGIAGAILLALAAAGAAVTVREVRT